MRGACQPDPDLSGLMLAAVRGSQRSNHPAPPPHTCNMQALGFFVNQLCQVDLIARPTAECFSVACCVVLQVGDVRLELFPPKKVS